MIWIFVCDWLINGRKIPQKIFHSSASHDDKVIENKDLILAGFTVVGWDLWYRTCCASIDVSSLIDEDKLMKIINDVLSRNRNFLGMPKLTNSINLRITISYINRNISIKLSPLNELCLEYYGEVIFVQQSYLQQ